MDTKQAHYYNELVIFDALPKDIRDIIRDHPYGTMMADIHEAIEAGVSFDSIRKTLAYYKKEAELNNLYPDRRLTNEIDSVWRKPTRNMEEGSHRNSPHTMRKR